MNRKKAIIALVVIFIGVYALHRGAKFFLYRLEKCDQPCRWQGTKLGYGSCAPLEVHLDVKTTPDPMGKVEAVWYRVTVTNTTCATLQLPTDFFMYNRHFISRERIASVNERYDIRELPMGTAVVVRDANGRELPEARNGGARGIGEAEKDIHPYGRDVDALDPLIQQIELPRTALSDRVGYSILAVPPGKSIAASATLLWPHRMVNKEYVTPDYIGTASVAEAVNMPDASKRFAVPPEGFRRMEEYALTQPGSYTAEFIFDDHVGLKLHHRRKYYPKWVLPILWFLAGGEPESWPYSGKLAVKASSGKIPFEVKR